MKKLYSTLAILAISASGAFAAEGDTWLLNEYATATPDSASTDSTYGYQVFKNPASKVTVNVAGGSVNLVATTIASDATEGYTANIGLLHPLTPDWAEHDLTGLTSITFEYQNDTKITDVLSVSFGSNAYSEAISKAGTVYSNDLAGASALAAGTTWKEGEVLISDFDTPSWWTTKPLDFPKMDSVLKRVKNLQFAPKTKYTGAGSQNGKACDACVGPTMTSITLKIRKIVLHGVRNLPWPNPTNIGCEETAPFMALSNFAEGKENSLGGYFFAYSDFDSTGTSTDKAKGASLVDDTVLTENAFMVMNAKLNKKVAGVYHPYSGFGAFGTNFLGKASLNATGLTGISFLLANAGTIDDKIVQSVIFKVQMKGVHDTAVHQVQLPMADIVAGAANGKMGCIRPVDLKQPAYVVEKDKVAFDPKAIVQIGWEAKITDDRSSAIDKATVDLLLAAVNLNGKAAFVLNDDPTEPIGVRPVSRVKTSVSYANGALVLNGFTGASRFEVRDLEGKVVSSFAATSRIALPLPRGTYLLTAKGEKASFASKFAVFDR